MEHAILSVPLPASVKAKMDGRRDIRWVEVARQAIMQKIAVLERMDALLVQSEFTNDDALVHGRTVSRNAWAKSAKKA